LGLVSVCSVLVSVGMFFGLMSSLLILLWMFCMKVLVWFVSMGRLCVCVSSVFCDVVVVW